MIFSTVLAWERPAAIPWRFRRVKHGIGFYNLVNCTTWGEA